MRGSGKGKERTREMRGPEKEKTREIIERTRRGKRKYRAKVQIRERKRTNVECHKTLFSCFRFIY